MKEAVVKKQKGGILATISGLFGLASRKEIQTTATVPYHDLGLVDGQCLGVGLLGVVTQSDAVSSGKVVKCSKCNIQLPL